MSTMVRDLQYGWRMLVKQPGFTAVAVLSIAIGIAGNTTVFSLFNAFRFRPLPFKDPERLVSVMEVNPKQGGQRNPTFRTLAEWKKQNHSFENMGMAGADSVLAYQAPGGAERIVVEGFDLDLPAVLGLEPILGRRMLPEDMGPVFSRTVWVSHDFWQRRLGGDPNVIGKKITMSKDSAVTVVGVLPPGSWVFPWQKDVELWLGFDLSGMPISRFMQKMARLKSGVSLEQAQAELAAISQRIEENQAEAQKGWVPHLIPLREKYFGGFQNQIYFLLGAVGFVLLIGCANTANLFLASGDARRKEFAIRASLGGGRARLCGQLLTESLLLSILGGALGLLLTVWGIRMLTWLAPPWFPLTDVVAIDARVLAFTAGISLLTGLVFGILPALQLSKVNWMETLKEGGRSSAPPARRAARALLLISETALAIVLLAGASLMIAGYTRVLHADMGFDPKRLLTMEFRPGGKEYMYDMAGGWVRITRKAEVFYRRLLDEIRALPGVESAGIVSMLPGFGWQRSFSIVGRAPVRPDERPGVMYNEADPDALRTLRIPLLKGRFLAATDSESSPWVVVINETMARRFFPGQDPIGQSIRLTMRRDSPDQPAVEEDRPRIIVGVVKDVKSIGMERDYPAIYTSYLQHPLDFPLGNYDPCLYKSLVVRTYGDPAGLASAVRRVVAGIDLSQAPSEPMTMEQVLRDSLAYPRFMIRIVGAFAGLALVLAAVGTYGVTAYVVSQRKHELAVRAALGARKANLIRLVLGGTLKLSLIGAVLGCVATVAQSAVLTRFLFGVKSVEPGALAGVAVLMMSLALAAGYFPAKRAAEVDPNAALRAE